MIYNRPTPRDLYYNEPGSEMPAGNLQLLELNIALLYSWDYYMTLREGIQEDTNISATRSLK